jgi:predicted PurR-regulated permease PerM
MANHKSSDALTRGFIDRVLAVVAIGIVVAAMWVVADLMLLIFGAVLVAVILRRIARPLIAIAGLGERWAIAAAMLLVIAVAGTAIGLFGAELSKQLQALSGQLVEVGRRLAAQIEISSMSDVVGSDPTMSRLGTLIYGVFAWGATLLGAATGLLLVVVGGVYLALDPARYRTGFLKLIPARLKSHVKIALDEAGEALGQWLVAQLMAMLLVGALTGVGLWLIGLPSALALGVIAGFAEFIPIAGPVLAAIPALMIAAAVGWETVLWVLALIVIIQQVESNIFMPLLVGRSVDIAPAVALFGIVAIGMIFGPLGLVFGFPLTVVIDVLVRRLYVHDTLGQEVQIGGHRVDKPSAQKA